jgi:hypothetical protein
MQLAEFARQNLGRIASIEKAGQEYERREFQKP